MKETDIQYFDKLVSKYSNTVYRVALSYVKDKMTAEDIMQNVFLRLFKKNPSFESGEHEKAWLIKVCANCSKSYLGKSYHKKETLFAGNEIFSGAENGGMEDESGLGVYNAVMDLKPAQRLCIHLYYYESYTVPEIAALTGMNISTVKSHMRRAREALKKKLGGIFDDE